MPFAKVRGIDIYHEVHGNGPRVLFISGTGSDLRREPNVFDVPGIGRLTICAYDHRQMVEFYQTSARANREDPVKRAAQNRQLAARAGHDAWDILPAITAPTLICGGKYDDIAPTARAEAMLNRLPNAKMREFEGGHLFMMEDRAAWPAMMDFLLAD